jgi:chromosome segregation ATPase
MAVGVPEKEVFAAADAVLARGERPTVERVRLELGRGSPARVGNLLDQWWTRLANRLNSETRLPELPGPVALAFVAVWQKAMHLAQGVAEQSLDEQRQVLDRERERVAAVEDRAQKDSAQFRQQTTDAVAGRHAAERRLADLELLLEQYRAQIEDLQQQRAGLVREREEAQQQTQQLQQEIQALHLKAEQDRVAQETYVRGVEDRAHREVDRAREETKDGARKQKDLSQQVEQLQLRLEAKQDELALAQQHAAAQQARADTLEAQLQRQQKPTPAKSRAKKTGTR